MKTELEKINGDNKRPGMPEIGYLVRYDLSEYHGWMCMRCFDTLIEAEAFAAEKEAEIK